MKHNEDCNDYWDNVLKINVDKDCDTDAPIREGDWLLIKFCTKKSVKHYVGMVLSMNDDGSPKVKYTRKKSKTEGETTFSFPVLDDISKVKHTEDIVTKLPKPAIGRRAQIVFKMSFNSFYTVDVFRINSPRYF